jgi:hypothetical protein
VHTSRLVTLLGAVLGSAVAGCSHGTPPAPAPAADTSFAAMQERGKAAMGVDQYTSAHIFEDLPDGGRIVLQRNPPDTAGTGAIRAHMAEIAADFSRGDFAVPGFVHGEAVPGTAVMAARRVEMLYVSDTLPRGGQVRITTHDSAAVTAVHQFLAFQRSAHHAAGHEAHSGHTP